MKAKLIMGGLAVLSIFVIYTSHLSSRPSYNGTTPGCGSGGGCHTVQAGIFSVATPGGLTVQVTVTGVTSGDNVAGELVDSTNTVVDVVEQTANNPFTLTAPGPGTFVVNAGYKQPSRQWDSVRFTLTPVGVEESPSEFPREYLLGQNYPNPFNPTTVISYQTPEAVHVTITLYDVLGQRVRTVVDGKNEAGYHEVTLDASGLASGVYMYRIEAGKFVAARKLVILK